MQHVADELALDLDVIDREALDVLEGGIARAEIVDRKAEALQLGINDEFFQQGQVAHGFPFGDLEHDPRWIDAGLARKAAHPFGELTDDQRLRRQVNEQHASVALFLYLRERLLDQLVIHLVRDAHALRFGDEVVGGHDPVVELDAHQQFMDHDLAGDGVADRLEEGHDALLVERVLDHDVLLAGLAEHFRHLVLGRDRDRVLAGALGLVHHVVRNQEEVLRIIAMMRADRDADRRGGPDPVAVRRIHRERFCQFRDALRDHVRLRVGCLRQDDAELVAAVARQQIAVAHRAAQQFCERLQVGVAEMMTETVVDGLEVVEVEHHHRKLLVMPLRAADLITE